MCEHHEGAIAAAGPASTPLGCTQPCRGAKLNTHTAVSPPPQGRAQPAFTGPTMHHSTCGITYRIGLAVCVLSLPPPWMTGVGRKGGQERAGGKHSGKGVPSCHGPGRNTCQQAFATTQMSMPSSWMRSLCGQLYSGRLKTPECGCPFNLLRIWQITQTSD